MFCDFCNRRLPITIKLWNMCLAGRPNAPKFLEMFSREIGLRSREIIRRWNFRDRLSSVSTIDSANFSWWRDVSIQFCLRDMERDISWPTKMWPKFNQIWSWPKFNRISIFRFWGVASKSRFRALPEVKIQQKNSKLESWESQESNFEGISAWGCVYLEIWSIRTRVPISFCFL